MGSYCLNLTSLCWVSGYVVCDISCKSHKVVGGEA